MNIAAHAQLWERLAEELADESEPGPFDTPPAPRLGEMIEVDPWEFAAPGEMGDDAFHRYATLDPISPSFRGF